MKDGTLLAAIDLGSNSFRMEIGRLEGGHIHRIEYLKETVRQGSGLDAERVLSQPAMQRGWDCLSRFAERLAGFGPRQVRAVATQTLREARNRADFIGPAQQVLGFPIDVIAGREEARLIYQGVAHLLPQSDERRLVVDIGGRSTEMILGQGYDATVLESYRLGCVAWSMRYFPDGQLSAKAFAQAGIAAKALLDEALEAYAPRHWDVAYGSSGTVGAVSEVLTAAGFPARQITLEGLDWLQERLIKARHVDQVRLDALKEDRRAVIGGGLAVLRAVFELLQIQQMQVAQGALRHGVLFDLLDRADGQRDLRAATVQRLAGKFSVDAAQAARVGKTAIHLFNQLAQEPAAPERIRQAQKLGWAAQLHEIGARISHSDYHKHGAYILDHADAPGFALPELHRLSQLVLGHRGKLHKLDSADFSDATFVQQLLALRLAVILCHARRDPASASLQLSGGGRKLTLHLPAGWADDWPQSVWLLREEALAWQKTPWQFRLTGDG